MSRLFISHDFPIAMEEMLRNGLALLWRAFHYARDLRTEHQTFAVSREAAFEVGLTSTDVNWLIARGYVKYVRTTPEFIIVGEDHTQTIEGLILTDSGVTLVQQIFFKSDPAITNAAPPASTFDTSNWRPRWDGSRKKLYCGPHVVKQYRWSAINQETVLMTFEEDGWPARIDDPLPQLQNLDPKQRLHDTIKCLNRNHKHRLIQFRGDGSGEGVLWTYADHPD